MTLSSAGAASTTAARIPASTTRPSSTTAPGPTAATTHAAITPVAIAVSSLFSRMSTGEIDRVHNRVGTLGRFDRSVQISFAAAVDAIAKNNERLAALLF